ncbi:MAG: hypothetical protein IID36_11465 [Planctomycetes bacterium]|nr:hypothetical protein [Planctomycetota bacterium]
MGQARDAIGRHGQAHAHEHHVDQIVVVLKGQANPAERAVMYPYRNEDRFRDRPKQVDLHGAELDGRRNLSERLVEVDLDTILGLDLDGDRCRDVSGDLHQREHQSAQYHKRHHCNGYSTIQTFIAKHIPYHLSKSVLLAVRLNLPQIRRYVQPAGPVQPRVIWSCAFTSSCKGP